MRHGRRRTWRGTAAAMTAGLLCCGLAAGKIPCGYDVEIVVQDCGIFGEDTEGLGIAPGGLVVGRFPDCQDGDPFYHAFLWPPPPGGGMQVVPLLVGGAGVYSMELFAANDAGQLVGRYGATDNGPLHQVAFLYQDGRFTSLGVLPGAIASEAFAVNAQGVAVGWSGFSARVSHRAVLWPPDGRMVDLSLDLGNPPLSEATDISDSGLVTGWMGLSPTNAIGFIWSSGRVIELPLLPEPGAYSTTASGVNDLGNVCGSGIANPGSGAYARAYAYIDGQPFSLGVLPGFSKSGATDINIHSQVIGSCSGGGPITGFIWDAGVMRALTDLIDPALNLHISWVFAISDAGIITGQASMPGGGHAVRLVPRSSADFDCDGEVDGFDLAVLLGQWGKCLEKFSCSGDVNSDGVVNGFDLALLLGDWG